MVTVPTQIRIDERDKIMAQKGKQGALNDPAALIDTEDPYKTCELNASCLLDNLIRSAEGNYADAQALLAYLMKEDPTGYREYYDSEIPEYDYWMNLAKENGYVEELPYDLMHDLAYGNVTLSEQDVIMDIYECALKGSMRCCRLLMAAYFDGDRDVAEQMIPAALGITAEEMITNLNNVVFASEYNFNTLNVKTDYINGLAMYASLNHDYKMLEMVREEVDKIQQYMEPYISDSYRSVALILAAEIYNQNIDDEPSGNGFGKYLDLAKQASHGEVDWVYDIGFDDLFSTIGNDISCTDAIVIVENNAMLYLGPDVEPYIIQTEREDYAVTASSLSNGDGWYQFSIWNIDAGTGYVAIRTDEIKQIYQVGNVLPASEEENETENTLLNTYALIAFSSLRIRAGAGASYETVFVLDRNELVVLIDEEVDDSGNKWYYIAHTNSNGETETGYVRSDLIIIPTVVKTPEGTPSLIYGTVTAETARIRGAADANAEVVGSLYRDEQAIIISVEQDNSGTVWYYVTNTSSDEEREIGYVRSDLISVTETIAIKPPSW